MTHGSFVSAEKQQHPRLIRLQREETGKEQYASKLHQERQREQTPDRLAAMVHAMSDGINQQTDSAENQPDGDRQDQPTVGEGNDTFLIGSIHR
jgi:hypothetical protein